MRVGVPKETWPGETRVALIPAAVGPLLKAGLAGRRRTAARARPPAFPTTPIVRRAPPIVPRAEVFQTADIILQVRATPPDPALRSGQAVIGFADPLGAPARASARSPPPA